MKKKFRVEGIMKFRLPIYIVLVFILASCEPDDNTLGLNIFPPSDTILVYTDTLYNLETQLVRSDPVLSSVDATLSSSQVHLLGALQDSITGLAQAEIVSQIAYYSEANFGTYPLLDSLMLWLYCADVEGDAEKFVRLKIHEFTGDLEYEEDYYSDYDVTDQYDPVPLVDEFVLFKADSLYEFYIDNPDYLDRIAQAIEDTVFTGVDNVQERFKGFYITTEVTAESNTMAKIGLANTASRFGFQYVHDSVHVDSVTDDNWRLYTMNFNQYYCQKLNIFHHDYTGTALEQMIDVPDSHSSILYVQGMAGVNVEIAVPEFDRYLDSMGISINSAKLVMEVAPDSITGIFEENYPDRLMLTNRISDTEKQHVYDYVTNSSSFGYLSKSNAVSAFLPPLYQYKFNLGLHYQSILTGDLDNTKLVLSIADPASSGKIIKLWSNDSDMDRRLRLELLYTKF